MEGASDIEQLMVTKRFRERTGLAHVRDELSIGVSGSETFNRTDIDRLLREKKERDNFDVLLVHDLSRLTRAGIDHSSMLIREFKKVGVRVVSATDSIPDGPDGEVMRALLSYYNAMYPRRLSTYVTTAAITSLKQRRRTHSTMAPYGVDRLIVNQRGEPVEIVRVWQNVRYVLDPATQAVRDAHHRQENGRFTTYTKMREHAATFVPGKVEAVALVNWIFSSYYGEGLGIPTITLKLNTEQPLKSFRGVDWNRTNVHQILINPVYLGYSWSARLGRSKFNSISEDGPVPALFDQTQLEGLNRKTLLAVRRPAKGWMKIPYPALAEFIFDPAIRAAAARNIDRYWSTWASRAGENPLKTATNRDTRIMRCKHVLRDVLFAEPGSLSMEGHSSSQAHRFYIVNESDTKYPVGDIRRRHFRAEYLERLALDVLRDAFGNTQSLQRIIAEVLREEIKANESADRSRAQIERTLRAKKGRLENLLDVEDEMQDRDVWRRAVKNANENIARLSAELASFNEKPILNENYIETLVKSELFDVPLPVPMDRRREVRCLINSAIKRMSIDLLTGSVHIDVRLPDQATCAIAATGQTTLDIKNCLSHSKTGVLTIASYVAKLPPTKDGNHRRKFHFNDQERPYVWRCLSRYEPSRGTHRPATRTSP